MCCGGLISRLFCFAFGAVQGEAEKTQWRQEWHDRLISRFAQHAAPRRSIRRSISSRSTAADSAPRVLHCPSTGFNCCIVCSGCGSRVASQLRHLPHSTNTPSFCSCTPAEPRRKVHVPVQGVCLDGGGGGWGGAGGGGGVFGGRKGGRTGEGWGAHPDRALDFDRAQRVPQALHSSGMSLGPLRQQGDSVMPHSGLRQGPVSFGC